MSEAIKHIHKTAGELAFTLRQFNIKNEYQFNINCSILNDFNHKDIRDDILFKEIFINLKNLNGPCLYWFEIVSNHSNTEIRQAIIKYRDRLNSKSVPALKKHFNSKSKCLYVGKVKRTLWGRIIQHMGFYPSPKTQGLQLFYWGKEINLKLKVHIYEFEGGFEELVSLFEKELAKKLEPITGKHK